MNYMQRGHYIAVINPLSYSSLISSDKDLSYGLYDTKTNQFFSTSKNADPAVLHGLIPQEDAFFGTVTGCTPWLIPPSARSP